MWNLDRPAHSSRTTFERCISRVRKPILKARLQAAIPAIEAASTDFDIAAQSQTLHTIRPQSFINSDVTTEEMEKVYTQRMVNKSSPGRYVYDDILGSSEICPLCAQRIVTTVDHHLPKAHYPSLAVSPLNLVPACTDCNKAKLDAVPATASDVTLHPYYDNLGIDQWLFARVIESHPAAVRFRLNPPSNWNDILIMRVRNHLHKLNSGPLYATQAAEELLNIRHQLVGLHATKGFEAVRNELASRAISSATGRPNGWRSATYYAWANSKWFCDGGFSS